MCVCVVDSKHCVCRHTNAHTHTHTHPHTRPSRSKANVRYSTHPPKKNVRTPQTELQQQHKPKNKSGSQAKKKRRKKGSERATSGDGKLCLTAVRRFHSLCSLRFLRDGRLYGFCVSSHRLPPLCRARGCLSRPTNRRQRGRLVFRRLLQCCRASPPSFRHPALTFGGGVAARGEIRSRHAPPCL